MPSLNQRIRIRTARRKDGKAKYVIRFTNINQTFTENGQVVKTTSSTTREIVPKDDSN